MRAAAATGPLVRRRTKDDAHRSRHLHVCAHTARWRAAFHPLAGAPSAARVRHRTEAGRPVVHDGTVPPILDDSSWSHVPYEAKHDH
jgi:hypothetical protein